MRRKTHVARFTSSLVIAAFALLPRDAFADRCANAALSSVLQRDFPGWTIVRPDDLIDEDREAWTKVHGSACPGLVGGSFLPGAKKVYALTAFKRNGNETQQMVLVAVPLKGSYELEVVDKPSIVANLAVLSKVGPGDFTNTDGKKITVVRDSIFLEAIDSGTSIYHYDHGRYAVDILSD